MMPDGFQFFFCTILRPIVWDFNNVSVLNVVKYREIFQGFLSKKKKKLMFFFHTFTFEINYNWVGWNIMKCSHLTVMACSCRVAWILHTHLFRWNNPFHYSPWLCSISCVNISLLYVGSWEFVKLMTAIHCGIMLVRLIGKFITAKWVARKFA